jgi:hypothetical protein
VISGASAELARNGFVIWREVKPGASTMEVSAEIGKVLDIEGLLPGRGIPIVQSLKPRERDTVGHNQYSGHYGLGEFPLHSDLAHWGLPPRYFLLRCIEGARDVFTSILPWTNILPTLGVTALQRAVFAGRRQRFGFCGLVRGLSRYETGSIFRFDPVFLRPLNAPAKELAALLADPKWAKTSTQISLSRPGDAILIDNWHVLHGRSAIPAGSSGRRVERVYLSEVSL